MRGLNKWLWKNKVFVSLLLVSAGWWSVVLRPGVLIEEWKGMPANLMSKVGAVFNDDKMARVFELRHVDLNHKGELFYISKFLYNKSWLVGDEFFSGLSYLSPRFYFQSGDGGQLSPSGVGPLVFLLFPFWVSGIFQVVKNKNRGTVFLMVMMGTFLVGKHNMAFLFLLMICNLYFSSKGLTLIKQAPLKKGVLILIIGVSIYEGGRALWLS